MDFTLLNYQNLLLSLKQKYSITSFYNFIQSPAHRSFSVGGPARVYQPSGWRNFSEDGNLSEGEFNHLSAVAFNENEALAKADTIISILLLRHDVDRLPLNALKTAQLEHKLGITGTYYFRIVADSFNEQIIKRVAELGHEIGYHYEDVDLTIKKLKNYKITRLKDSKVSPLKRGQDRQADLQKPYTSIPDTLYQRDGRTSKKEIVEEELIDLAYESFCKNLEKMREVADIKTICMHGSPLSPFDNKIIWKKYDYKELGIIGEPYLDIDWNECGYFTDTGRRWNGDGVSVRDKVVGSRESGVGSEKALVNSHLSLVNGIKLRSTQDIIKNINVLPDKVMFTIHPQRWSNRPVPWIKELFFQNSKNVVKRIIIAKLKD